LRRTYHSLFEALAFTPCGAKVHGIAYRNGKLSRDAACYQFRDCRLDGQPDPEDHLADKHTLAVRVQRRLGELLARKDIDLLYLRFVAGWSQAEMARARACHRSTIKRREDRITKTVRLDPLLLQFAGASA
jgi:DNA-directed RNA polymerase specialized sigma24 family protein